MKKILTLKILNDLQPNTVFAKGICINSPDDIYMTSSNINRKLKWVAKRGAINDWAIYVHWADNEYEFVEQSGDKLTYMPHIKKLVPCDEEAASRYRY